MGSFRLPGCYDFVRTDQRGWDLLDVMDVLTLYALTRGVRSFRCHGCFDFVRTDQRGWDLLDVMNVMTLYACYLQRFLDGGASENFFGFGGASEQVEAQVSRRRK